MTLVINQRAGLLALALAFGTAIEPRASAVEKNAETLRSSQFTSIAGLAAENADGEKLGKLKDFVLDAESGRVEYAIISSSWLGVGKRQIVPARLVSVITTKKGI